VTLCTKGEAVLVPHEFIQGFRDSVKELTQGDRDLLSDHSFRLAVLQGLLAADHPQDHSLISQLVETQIAQHIRFRDGMSDEYPFSVFLLARRKSLSDLKLLWQAKTANSDTQMGLPIAFLVMAGVNETLSYCSVRGGVELTAAHDYIQDCHAKGNLKTPCDVASYESYYSSWTVEDIE